MKHLRAVIPFALLFLAACGGTGPTPTPPTTPPPPTTTPPVATPPPGTTPPPVTTPPDDPSDDVELVEFYVYETDFGSNHAIGIVRNNGSTGMEFLKLTANFYDDDDVLIGTDYTYADREILLPGETSSFSLLSIGDSLETYENNEVLAEWRQTSETPARDLEVSGLNLNGDTLLGQVTNNGTDNYQYVDITSNCFNEADELADVNSTYAEADVLAPGQSSSFSIDIYAERDDLETCEAFAEGLPL